MADKDDSRALLYVGIGAVAAVGAGFLLWRYALDEKQRDSVKGAVHQALERGKTVASDGLHKAQKVASAGAEKARHLAGDAAAGVKHAADGVASKVRHLRD
ncbi:MAG: hypothetical protein AABX89_00110 [Candidatus Thermoplasmatota archaeon]